MGTTHILVIIDASGSMTGHRKETIGSYHSYLDSLVADKDITCKVTTVLFSSTEFYQTVGAGLSPEDPELRLDGQKYRTMGGTALLDATGRALTEFIDSHNELGPEDKVIVVTITDGEENQSREWTTKAIKPLITSLQAQGWHFLFLAQGLDAWTDAKAMGYSTSDYVGTRSIGERSLGATGQTMSHVTKDVGRSSGRGMRTNTAAGYMAQNLDADEIINPGVDAQD